MKFNNKGKAIYMKMVVKKFCCALVVFLLLLVSIISGEILTYNDSTAFLCIKKLDQILPKKEQII